MKERIKKFWEDHGDGIMFGAAFSVVTGLAAYNYARHENEVTGVVPYYLEDDDSLVNIGVFKKNGKMNFFDQRSPEE